MAGGGGGVGFMGRSGKAEREENFFFYSSAARSLVCFGGHFFHRLMGADEASAVSSLPGSHLLGGGNVSAGRLLKQHVSPNATPLLCASVCVCVELLTPFDTIQQPSVPHLLKKKRQRRRKKKKLSNTLLTNQI